MPRFESVRYIGAKDGASARFLGGVPARDMTGDEWYALDADLREHALRLSLYEGVSAETHPRTKKLAVAEPSDETGGAVMPVELVADEPAEGGN